MVVASPRWAQSLGLDLSVWTEDIARLQALTDSMLGLLRDDDPDQVCQRVSLQLVVGEAINLVAPQALNQEIIIEDSVGKLEVKGNEQRLIQLVTILLDNAIKYSPKQSTVFISSTKKGKTTILCVRDEGIGMSEATKSAIFTRFYRADESRSTTPGYGLGMAIAKKIVDAHGGKIGIDSEPNKGSTVTIHLPSAI